MYATGPAAQPGCCSRRDNVVTPWRDPGVCPALRGWIALPLAVPWRSSCSCSGCSRECRRPECRSQWTVARWKSCRRQMGQGSPRCIVSAPTTGPLSPVALLALRPPLACYRATPNSLDVPRSGPLGQARNRPCAPSDRSALPAVPRRHAEQCNVAHFAEAPSASADER
jgi:hypothetical protein